MLAAASSSLLRRSSSRLANKSLVAAPTTSLLDLNRRWKSDDVGDVIGIDLGTTNSCVAIMVRDKIRKSPYGSLPVIYVARKQKEMIRRREKGVN
jgi:hypothetical protein